jgi:hypothetical protein
MVKEGQYSFNINSLKLNFLPFTRIAQFLDLDGMALFPIIKIDGKATNPGMFDAVFSIFIINMARMPRCLSGNRAKPSRFGSLQVGYPMLNRHF